MAKPQVGSVFRELSPYDPLGLEFLDEGETDVFSLVLPTTFCAHNDSFILVPTLTEFPFQSHVPSHPHKTTFVLPKAAEETIYVPEVDRDLPILLAEITVNRSEFPPRSGLEDPIEWYLKLTERTRGIAHELLLAWQYLTKFHFPSRSFATPISTPTHAQDCSLICPPKLIEESLHTFDQHYGTKIRVEEDFTNLEGTNERSWYTRYWLENHRVHPDIVCERTADYLRYHPRNAVVDNVKRAIEEYFPSTEHSLDSFSRERQNDGLYYREFHERCRTLGYDPDVVDIVAQRCLR